MRVSALRVPGPAAALLLVGAGCATPSSSAPDIVWASDRAAPQGAPDTTVPEQCREYTQTVIIGGEEQQATGLVCRQPHGTWRFQPPAGGSSQPATVYVPTPVYRAPYYGYGPYYGPSPYFGSAFFFSHRHHHHRHFRHRRFR